MAMPVLRCRIVAADTRLAINPAFDLVEKEKEYEITAELPGIDEKNVEIKLSNHLLTIKGEKAESKEKKETDYCLSERRFGSFQRSFQVPEGVDADKIDATFAKGVRSALAGHGRNENCLDRVHSVYPKHIIEKDRLAGRAHGFSDREKGMQSPLAATRQFPRGAQCLCQQAA